MVSPIWCGWCVLMGVPTIRTWGELSLVDDLPVVRARESFEAFYRRQYRQVLGLAIVLSGNRSVAEELAQEAFLAALRNWHRVGQMENPGSVGTHGGGQ